VSGHVALQLGFDALFEDGVGFAVWSWRHGVDELRHHHRQRAAPPNRAPVVMYPLDDQYAMSGEGFAYTFPANAFYDPDGNPLTYTASKSDGTALPGWLYFDAASRTFYGTPSGPVGKTEKRCQRHFLKPPRGVV